MYIIRVKRNSALFRKKKTISKKQAELNKLRQSAYFLKKFYYVYSIFFLSNRFHDQVRRCVATFKQLSHFAFLGPLPAFLYLMIYL